MRRQKLIPGFTGKFSQTLGNREQGTGNREQGTVQLGKCIKMSEINDFKDLIIWQKGMDIAEKCYFLTNLFPKHEMVWSHKLGDVPFLFQLI
jgi:hypothetical protein